MFRWITIGILSLGILGLGVWGYQEHQEKNAVLIQAENTYQRAFHELSYHIDMIHDKIGTTLAMNSKERLSPQFVEIWRLTSEALANVSELPLSLVPFNKTEEFLANIGDFTYETAIRDLSEEPLTKKETEALKKLQEQSADIKDEMRGVQHAVLENDLRWMDVQLALSTKDEQADNTIVDGIETVESKTDKFANSTDTPSFMQTQEDRPYKNLEGDPISEEKAISMAKDLFEASSEEEISVSESREGANTSMYSLSYEKGDETAHMDISEKGGHPLSMIVNRPIDEKEISLNDGMKRAEKYLKEREFDNMVVYQSNEYNNVGVYSFLAAQDDIRIFSDAVQVKVALDNGDILGLDTKNYFMNHTDRDIPEAKLTKKEAKDNVNENVDIHEEHMAIIDDTKGDEVLAYEFLGTMNDKTYRIFINAMNGSEEKVEQMGETEINFAISPYGKGQMPLPIFNV